MTRINELGLGDDVVAGMMKKNDPDVARDALAARLPHAAMHDHEMVREFQARFQVPMAATPRALDGDAFEYRKNFMLEELREFAEAYDDDDLVKQADALCDLAYVVFGTALMMGLPWRALFMAVHAANMKKVSAAEAGVPGRHPLDVVKPAGWIGPEIHLEQIMIAAGWERT